MPEPPFLAKMRLLPMLDMNFTLWSWEAGRRSEGCGEEEEELSGESKVLLSFGTLGRAEEGTGVPCS